MRNWTRLAAGFVLGAGVHSPSLALAQQAGPGPVTVRADAGPMVPLEGTRWRWVRSIAPDGKQLVPSQSTKYWIELLPAGNLVLNADCNRGHGMWSQSGKDVKLQPLATTLMACPPGSLDSRFLQLLGQAATYELEGGELVLTLQPGAGVMRLAPFKAAGRAKGAGELSGTRWRWVEYEQGFGNASLHMGGHDPSRYELAFLPDGQLRLRSDCNRGGGKWSTGEERKLILDAAVMTRVMCPPGSASDEFVRWLNGSERYLLTGDSLAIQLSDGGTMRFTRASPAPARAPPPPPR